ncbi:discoidin domain-containing protein [Pedobacter lusitanus]|uniref:discoidin domain-containing protein n=1 Tax=Pedobacter lusitanus TaxID=1503925 RepID=UPI0006963253|nr:discoidin domain-containing protein [Pedobacter lusitanus]
MKKKLLSIILLIGSLIVIISCKRVVQEPGDGHSGQTHTNGTAVKGLYSGIYNLNVVYFVPTDLDTVPGYKERINGVMAYTQNFYKKWLTKWGYPNQSMGLPVDASGKLKMLLLRGTAPKAQYPYEGGAGKMMDEINAYYAAHPGEKSSDHILVITPTYTYGADGDPSGGPFYGIGRWCFALDYTGLDTLNLGKPEDKFSTKWIGGFVHELGHGINLPHDGGKKSENTQYGTTLMGFGNSTFGKAPTYLAPADIAILANCQVFSNTTRSDWYTSPGLKINKFSANYKNGNIIVAGKFSSTSPVKNIGFYHRNIATDDGGYSSVTFATKPIGLDSFYISMPVSEFYDKGNTKYELYIRYSHENGSTTDQVLNYAFENDTPVISYNNKPVYNKSNWTISSYSSQETTSENGAAANIIDGDLLSSWHSNYSASSPGYPHYLVINMGSILDVNRFTFWQRNSRKVKAIEILTSNDALTWTSLGNFTLTDSNNPQDIKLPSVKKFKYFKLNMKSSYDGEQFASLLEVGTYKD